MQIVHLHCDVRSENKLQVTDQGYTHKMDKEIELKLDKNLQDFQMVRILWIKDLLDG